MDLFVEQQLASVGPPIHDVYFGDAADCPLAGGVDFARHVQHLIVGYILVGWDHAQDDSAGLHHVLLDHFAGDLVDVLVLPLDGDAGQPRQVDDREVGAVRRIYVQDDRIVHDVLLLPANLIR